MVKFVFAAVFSCFLLLGFSQTAHAVIVMDFESPNFAPDAAVGDNSHTYGTTYGAITFNGRIWNEINSSPVVDHTPTGSGYFLKNTDAKAKVTLNFAFDVSSFELYWLGLNGANMNGAVYDVTGAVIGSGTAVGDRAWHFVSDSPLTPIRSIAFWTGTGNRMAIDDLKIIPLADVAAIPEPASMSLLGMGLLGLVGIAKKRKNS